MYRKVEVSIFVVLLALLSGCAGVRPAENNAKSSCLEFFKELDGIVDQARTRDSQAARIKHFPNLRINRFIASFRENITEREVFQFWYGLLQSLDIEARRLELKNTPKSLLAQIGNYSADVIQLTDKLERCRSILRESDFNAPNRMKALLENAEVVDDYSDLKRILGVYYLTRFFVSKGVDELNDAVIERFQGPLETIPVTRGWVYFSPPKEPDRITLEETRRILRNASVNPLGVPVLSPVQQDKLFTRYAPVWEIDIATDNDRIGTPYWPTADALGIDLSEPRTYKHLSYGRFNGEILIQLNYVIWFPSRPLTGIFDLLGGHLDGINWRVTLGSDGHPLFHDSIHNCGCYHLFFPGKGIRVRQQTNREEEPIRSIDVDFDEQAPVVVRIASSTHYIQRVYSLNAIPDGLHYALVEYDELRSIPYSGDTLRRSMFDTESLVAGSERKERWLLWPMGIPSPGAMRQWGHHATAFVGRRHFDDADLFDRLFFKTD